MANFWYVACDVAPRVVHHPVLTTRLSSKQWRRGQRDGGQGGRGPDGGGRGGDGQVDGGGPADGDGPADGGPRGNRGPQDGPPPGRRGRGRGGNLRALQRGRPGGGRPGGGRPGGGRPGGNGGGGRLVMLNADMALISNLNVNDQTGAVSCAIRDSPGNEFPVCQQARTFDQVVAYSRNNGLWLRDFQAALTKMVNTGQTVPDNCPSFPCRVL